jgi:hypothetical protein
MLSFNEELHVIMLLIHKYTANLKYFHTLIYKVTMNRTNALIWSVNKILDHKPEIPLQIVGQNFVPNLPIYLIIQGYSK